MEWVREQSSHDWLMCYVNGIPGKKKIQAHFSIVCHKWARQQLQQTVIDIGAY